MVFDNRGFRQSRSEGSLWPGRALWEIGRGLGISAITGVSRPHIATRLAQQQPIRDAQVALEQHEIGNRVGDMDLSTYGARHLGRVVEAAIADPNVPTSSVETVLQKAEEAGLLPTALDVSPATAQLLHGRATDS